MSLGHVLTEGYYSAMSNLQERDVMDCRSWERRACIGGISVRELRRVHLSDV